MKGTPFQKILLAMTLAAIGLVLLLHFIDSKFKPQPPTELPAVSSKPEFKYAYPPPAPKANLPAEAEEEADGSAQPKIARDKAEDWVAKHNRNAASLLAAFRALADTNLLFEAAMNFPNDPQVQLAVLSRNVFPEDRRKWLEAFKASAPSNSLANYLSAADYFKAGKSEEALQELLAASGKSEFQNYAMETMLNGEELSSDSGMSARSAAMAGLKGMAEESLPQLASFKFAAQGVSEIMKQKSAAGDVQSVNDLAQIGLNFSDKINSGDSGKFLINQLVAMASEQIILAQLDQNTHYDFLDDKTPDQVRDSLRIQKQQIMQMTQAYQIVAPTLTDAEFSGFFRRVLVYGEADAKKWLIQQYPPPDPAK